MSSQGVEKREAAEAPGATYSAYVGQRGERIVAISGLLPVGRDNELVGPGFREQAESVFEQLQLRLQAIGASTGDLLRVGGFLVDLDDYAEYAAIRGERFGDLLPASTVVQVAGLVIPGSLVEIDALAVL